MSLFSDFQTRQLQKKANNFIKSLDKLSDKEIEQAYLDNKEFQNNEIVLSYLFFKLPSIIRILPLDFQISRLNSNLNMFEYGSSEARRKLISGWLSDNKFFTNANAINLTDEQVNSYLSLYFKQPEDVAKLHMVDLRRTIEVLVSIDVKETENIISKIKDDLTDRQWEYIIVVYPMFIKYASQDIQNKYAEDEKYNKFINGEAREKFIKKQMELIKEDISLLDTVPIDVQVEYIKKYPYMINSLSKETLIKILQYDLNLIRYLNISSLKSSYDHSLEIVHGLLNNIESKSIRETIDILVNKGLLNAKGKLYRFDKSSNDTSYQYTTELIEIIQNLTVEQMVALIKIDVNYALPYVVPLFYSEFSRDEKDKVIIDSNFRCLNLFKAYYGDEIYNNYYKVVNKIYNDYLVHYDKYEYSLDYNCIFDILKVLFNKNIITKNKIERVTVFVGMSLLYKGSTRKVENSPTVKLLNDLLSVAYDREIINDKEIYDINSLELFDKLYDFISPKLLDDYNNYNFLNISSLLFINKSKHGHELFKKYYDIVVNIHGENKESLFKACENFQYYVDILRDINDVVLDENEETNLINLLATYTNNCNIERREQLKNYSIVLLKKLASELSVIKDGNIIKNLICNYLFNKPYDVFGDFGFLESDTIKEICKVYDPELLNAFMVDDEIIFTEDEVNLYRMIYCMFNVDNNDLLLTYLSDIISEKIDRNIINVISLFNKLKKYRVDIINHQLVTLEDLELLCEVNPKVAKKSIEEDVVVYTIIGQDFKALYSANNDGYNYHYDTVISLNKNYYGYNQLVNNGSVRFTFNDDVFSIKVNKDKKDGEKQNPDFILVPSSLNEDILRIARDKNMSVVVIRE